jgi:hypothetical protein
VEAHTFALKEIANRRVPPFGKKREYHVANHHEDQQRAYTDEDTFSSIHGDVPENRGSAISAANPGGVMNKQQLRPRFLAAGVAHRLN